MELGEFKAKQRRLWADGDYRPVGRMLDRAARTLVERLGVAAHDRVLDVATGSGSVAVAAARTGADVLGVDITDAWLGEARSRAAAAGVEVAFVLGDVEHLPVATGAFDVVLSSFGAIFAPRHAVAAAELARVCRPGGRIGMTAWPPDGTSNRVMSTLAPDGEPPPFATPPIRWGDPEHVRRVWSDHDVTVDITRPAFPIAFPSLTAFETFALVNSGGLADARRELERTGRWDEALARFRDAAAEVNEAEDGTYRATWDFLVIVASRAGPPA